MEPDFPSQVQRTLADYLEIRRSECKDLDPAFAEAVQELVDFVLGGGKRIRPTFAWWGWRAAGGTPDGPGSTAMLRAASALELIQACALVHDDLIDDSDTRRGNPTVHEKFAANHQRAQWHGDRQKFGMASSILLGDLALSWADDMLHDAGLEPGALARGIQPWRSMRTEVLAGQYLDVLGQARRDETPDAALRIDELKSASYTVVRPLQLGAEIGGADPETLSALHRYGSEIGVAFQLRDDLLGVFGDPELTGKPAGDDLREGKRTFLMASAMHHAQERDDQEALDVLRSSLGQPELSQDDVDRVRQVLSTLGAVRTVEDRIAALLDSATTALKTPTLPEEAAAELSRLAVAVTDRNH